MTTAIFIWLQHCERAGLCFGWAANA